MDAAHLLLMHPGHIAKAREVARAYRIDDKLETWLNDPRVRSKVEEDLRERGTEGRKVLEKLAALMPRPPRGGRSRERRR